MWGVDNREKQIGSNSGNNFPNFGNNSGNNSEICLRIDDIKDDNSINNKHITTHTKRNEQQCVLYCPKNMDCICLRLQSNE